MLQSQVTSGEWLHHATQSSLQRARSVMAENTTSPQTFLLRTHLPSSSECGNNIQGQFQRKERQYKSGYETTKSFFERVITYNCNNHTNISSKLPSHFLNKSNYSYDFPIGGNKTDHSLMLN